MTAGVQRLTGTFDLKPNAAPIGAKPDELMIDWTTLPKGSKATIYMPAANASEILDAAARIHGSQPFAEVDAHTVSCKAYGYVYLPVPIAQGGLAGLLDVALPADVPIGARLTTAARQLTTKTVLAPRDRAVGVALARPSQPPASFSWRTVAGSFQLALRVRSESQTLTLIERKLSILRWIFETIPSDSRWRPVFIRYLGVVAGQVSAAGGDPRKILPYRPGGPPDDGLKGQGEHGSQSGPKAEICVIGKIEGLIFDHFGDFEGFILETEEGERFEFFSRERNVRDVAECAWAERLRTTVYGQGGADRRPRRIVLHPAAARMERG